jgi:hypothetical protein
MSHSARRSQRFRKFRNLQLAIEIIVKEAALRFPEAGSDLDKWEWTRVLTLVLFEAAKRRDLSPKKIVHRSEQIVRRQLEKEKSEALLGQEFAPLEEK